MSQSELLRRAKTVLDAQRIPYMLTGSLASTLQGEPRSTHDIDLVVDLTVQQVKPLLDAFAPPAFYLSEASVRDAIRNRRMFNLLEINTGDKIDFWLLTDDEFDQSRFQRLMKDQFDGIEIDVSTPEDTILMKLRWGKESGNSERQFQDALRVYEVQYSLLDLEYIAYWVNTLQVEELWSRLQAEAEPLEF
jgi:hypothetical protein